jgi:hypothetical protein
MKIFISSTVYDLLDIRSEVYEYLRNNKLNPILSDVNESDFRVLPTTNSIETCLENVRQSEHFILILSQRYGPKLGKCGFEDYSATHLEYREAVKNKIPIMVYVRDRFFADYTLWKKNGNRNDLEFGWVRQNQSDLFEFFDEHCRLTSDSKPNWYKSFSTSVDLISIISFDFKQSISKSILLKSISEDAVPIFNYDANLFEDPENLGITYTLKMTFKNIGNKIAYNTAIRNRFKEFIKQPVIAPADSFTLTLYIPTSTIKRFYEEYHIEYGDGVGNIYIDTFVCNVSEWVHEVPKINCYMIKREYKLGVEPELNIIQ